MDNLTLRSYRRSDARAISHLFREIYGDHYVQPHVYLPLMINQNHGEGRWHSLVAESGKKSSATPRCAETRDRLRRNWR